MPNSKCTLITNDTVLLSLDSSITSSRKPSLAPRPGEGTFPGTWSICPTTEPVASPYTLTLPCRSVSPSRLWGQGKP